jgi:hypothetical protein
MFFTKEHATSKEPKSITYCNENLKKTNVSPTMLVGTTWSMHN